MFLGKKGVAKMRRLVSFLVLLFVALAGQNPAIAQTLSPPQGDPILEVSGKISNTNAPGKAVFDRASFEALGLETIKTSTPWHTGQVTFEGVPLDKLMRAVGAQGKNVRMVALNDYAAIVPVEDFAKYGVILALKRDGQYMPVRDKGPLFVIYPYDSAPELKSQVYYARSVWQVKSMEVLD